ncbi:MAG: response regulator [Proteobacteria bacterium]|nr:response regulator [Pseudomonadota bacterium]
MERSSTAWFAPEDVPAFLDFWGAFEASFVEITSDLTPIVLAEMPTVAVGVQQGRIRRDQPDHFRVVAQAAREGRWGVVEDRLVERGTEMAAAGVSIDEWIDLVLLGQRFIAPRLVQAFAADPPRLTHALVTMHRFYNQSIRMARRHYDEAKRRLDDERQRALDRSERRFTKLIETGVVGVLLSDTAGPILEANDAFLEMLGYTQGDLADGTLRWDALTPPEWAHVSHALVHELVAQGSARPMEKEYLHKDGSRVPVLVGSAMLVPPECVTVILDLSDRRKLEEQLRQAQKMEAIGRLAGGIAHDFNNLIFAMLGYCSLVLDDLPANHNARDDVEQIQLSATRAAALVRQLLAFSRQQVLSPQAMNLTTTVVEMLQLLRTLVGGGGGIEFVVNVRPVANIHADPTQLSQVIMNLAINARDAMPNGGKLIIETSDVELDGSQLKALGLTQPKQVLLAISDTGVGMDAETQSHIFEPFFSTKGSQGTGLGLATVFGVVRQSGGAISVYSEPGRGTTFKIHLPQTDQVVKPVDEPSLLATIGTETILLVEDDPIVRALLVELLGRPGYRVLEAADPARALELIADHDLQIDLLLTDVMMPLMNGYELAKQARRRRADLKVIFMSGFSETRIAEEARAFPHHFVAKPISNNEILQVVRRVLDDGAPVSRSIR